MRDVIWTLIVVWVIYKIVNALKGGNTYVFNKHTHHHHSKKEGEIKINNPQINTKSKNNNTKNDGEYVDYEEIK